MQRVVRRLVVGLGLLSLSAGCVFSCEADTVPDPLTCTNAPAEAQIRELELGTGPREPVLPLVDNDPTYVIVDLEGRLLVSLRVLWSGPSAPSCGQVDIRVRHPETGVELDGEAVQLLSSPSAGNRASGEIYFVVDTWPAYVDVELESYGVSTTRRVQVGGLSADAGPPDAGTDASPVDAGPSDASPADSGPTDSGPVDSGPTDSGPVDSGPTDSGPSDSGPVDSGPSDAGLSDAGLSDAGSSDAGSSDAGSSDAG